VSNVAPLFPENHEPCIAVEQALLAALLYAPKRALADLPEGFTSAHYLDPFHRDIHETIVAADGRADTITIAAIVANTPEESSYVSSLLASPFEPRSAGIYANVITEAFLRREIEDVFKKAGAMLARPSGEHPAAAVIQTVVGGLDGLISGAHTIRRGRSFDQAMDEAIEQAGRAYRGELLAGVSTGMPTVDDVIGTLDPATFYVLAARPGMGKTGLACGWAVRIARQCKEEGRGGVLGLSLEMSAEKLARRTLAEHTRIPVKDIQRGKLDGRVEQLQAARFALGGLPLWIEDAGGQNIATIRQKARAATRRFGKLRLLWVDHLQIVEQEAVDRRNGGTQAIGHISNGLRELSKEFDCPVLALSQLSRDLLKRDDKRPNLGDLRQSGEIEQDADVVMFVHREEMYLGTSQPPRNVGEKDEKYETRVADWQKAVDRQRGQAELICAKVRDGDPRTIKLLFDGPTTSFREPQLNTDVPPADLMDWHDSHDRDLF